MGIPPAKDPRKLPSVIPQKQAYKSRGYPTVIREEFVGDITPREQVLRRWTEERYHLRDVSPAAIGLVFWVLAGEEMSTLKNIPNLFILAGEK